MVARLLPFVVRLKDRTAGATQPIAFKTDPGANTTGIALIAATQHGTKTLLLAEVKHHKAEIHKRNASAESIPPAPPHGKPSVPPRPL